MAESNAPSGAAIEIRALSKVFETKAEPFVALSPLDVDISPGEFVSIVGPSGCGKSTLMLMVAGLLSPTSGSIVVNGQELTKPLTDVGIVFQEDLLLGFRTALGNVALQRDIRKKPGRAQAKAEAMRLLKELGLEKAADRYPNQLSGGMRQRVSIARALVHDPSVLLMDEPFGALDALTRVQMRRDVEAVWMRHRKTVLFITHGIDEAVGLSDRVLVMSPSPGRLVADIRIDLPRPRPVELGGDDIYADYIGQIYEIFQEQGVLK